MALKIPDKNKRGGAGMNNMDLKKSAVIDCTLPRPVTPEERRLLDFFRDELQFGEAHVIVKKGQPVYVRYAIRELKLD